ncbi:MAG: TRAP transporter large permease [Moorellales bacterium]
MSPVLTGILGLIVLVAVCLAGVPVSFAMAVIGFMGFAYLTSIESAFSMAGIELLSSFSSYSLSVVPAFALMGYLAFSTGISKRLYDAVYTMFGHIRGGLGIATILGCAGFSAICGSTSATAASMGAVALPEMQRYRYNQALATGCVAAGGTLGILIPPSTVLVVYGVMTEQSIGKLLIAGILPGLLLTSLFVLVIVLLCLRNPAIAPAGERSTLRQKVAGLSAVAEVLIIFCLVMGGLFTGWFTPTQAGGAGCLAILVLVLIRRRFGWKEFLEATKETALLTAMVLMIVAGGTMFSRFIAVTGLPFILRDWMAGLPLPPTAIMLLIMVMHLLGGCFMDAFALIILTVPIFFPLVIELGFDPIWFGVAIVLLVEAGAITPPVGLNVFVIKGIARDVPIETIFKGAAPFVVAVIACIAILTIFPQIATFLPNLMR